MGKTCCDRDYALVGSRWLQFQGDPTAANPATAYRNSSPTHSNPATAYRNSGTADCNPAGAYQHTDPIAAHGHANAR